MIFLESYDKINLNKAGDQVQMKIGEKIKKLRTSKLMTQSDLVGGEITRNMLSQIENGSANPSLDTVRYIASRLNVSVGYLLSEGAEERMYLKHGQIEGIKNIQKLHK